jgi:hypothetical protein
MPVTADLPPRPPVKIPAGSRVEPEHLNHRAAALQAKSEVLAMAREVQSLDGSDADHWSEPDQVMVKGHEHQPGLWKKLTGRQKLIDAQADFDERGPVALKASLYKSGELPNGPEVERLELDRLPDGSVRYATTRTTFAGSLTSQVGESKTSTYWTERSYYEVQSTTVTESPDGTLLIDLDSGSGTYY